MVDSEAVDLFATNNYIPFSSNESTVEYLNETIGDVIGDILDQCSKEAPSDPILYVAELLERLIVLLPHTVLILTKIFPESFLKSQQLLTRTKKENQEERNAQSLSLPRKLLEALLQ